MKQIIYNFAIVFISLLITSCTGNTERSWSANDSTSMVEAIDSIMPEVVQEEPEVVIPEELDDFVVTSQGGYGAYVRKHPSTDSEKLKTYRDGTSFTGAYTDVPHWIMIVEDGHIVGYIHDENVSPEYNEDEYEGGYTDYDDPQNMNNYNNNNNNYSWLQGTWTINAVTMGQTSLAKIVISGNYAKAYADNDVLDEGVFEIYDGKIHFGSFYSYIDEEKQLIKFDDTHYYNHSSIPTTTATVGTPAQNEELRIMKRLKELGNMQQELTIELQSMYRSGRMDPHRYIYIKSTILNYKDEQIQLARKLGNNQLVLEYQQQKQQQLQAFRMLENGY